MANCYKLNIYYNIFNRDYNDMIIISEINKQIYIVFIYERALIQKQQNKKIRKDYIE
jgi:hypothetical protein